MVLMMFTNNSEGICRLVVVLERRTLVHDLKTLELLRTLETEANPQVLMVFSLWDLHNVHGEPAGCLHCQPSFLHSERHTHAILQQSCSMNMMHIWKQCLPSLKNCVLF